MPSDLQREREGMGTIDFLRGPGCCVDVVCRLPTMLIDTDVPRFSNGILKKKTARGGGQGKKEEEDEEKEVEGEEKVKEGQDDEEEGETRGFPAVFPARLQSAEVETWSRRSGPPGFNSTLPSFAPSVQGLLGKTLPAG